MVASASSSAVSLNDTSFLCPTTNTPPILTTYASLFKIDEITEEMLNIRKELAYNTKHKDTIKEQIKQLEDELVIVESKIDNNKTQLKQLAVKIADC